MPFLPELFSFRPSCASKSVGTRDSKEFPFFDGLMAGEIDALVGSFAGEPEVHPGARAYKGRLGVCAIRPDTTGWMAERGVTVEDVDSILTPSRGVEEFVLHVDGDARRIELPMALAADLDPHARMTELRIYFSRWPLSGVRGVRPPVLQPDPELQAPDVVGDYHQALAAGDVDAVVAAFEPGGYVREPAGSAYTHRGTRKLRAFYELLFADRGGMPFELCAVADDGRACSLEYNVVARGRTNSPPGAGIAVHVRGDGGRLAAVRLYGDVDPPLSRHLQAGPRTESRDARSVSR